MTRYIAKHTGDRAQIIRVAGGNTVTLKSGEEALVEPQPDLTDELILHYQARGVTFLAEGEEEAEGKTNRKTAAQRRAEAAAEKASAEKAAAEKAEAERQAAIAEAEKAVADAKALLETVGDDLAAKAEAEKMVTDAEAALAALQA